MSVALLPVEAVYWLGLALPIPWVLGASRVALWRRLGSAYGDLTLICRDR